jgi:sugar-specific transcriptional regulator TrmB
MQPLIDNLKELGFSEYESKAYVALLSHPVTTGYELAKVSGVPASKIYQTLQRLVNKNVVSVISGDPQKYVGQDPALLLRRYRDNFDDLFGKLSSGFKKLKVDEKSSQMIWNIDSRDEIFRYFREKLESCQGEILLSVWERELEELEPVLKEAADKGCAFHIVLFGEKRLDFGNVYHHGREKIILRERGRRRMNVVFDNEVVLIAHFSGEDESNAVFTSNPALVLLARDYIIHDIYTVKIAEKYGEEAQQLFGI